MESDNVVIQLRDNRAYGNARTFKRITSGPAGRFVSNEFEGLDKTSVPEYVETILSGYNGDRGSLGNLINASNGAVIDLSGSRHMNKDRNDLRFVQYQKKDNGFSLATGNLMGVLRFRNPKTGSSVQIEVLSRFDQDENSFFLNYLLSRVFDFAQGVEAVSAWRSSLLDILLDIVFVRRLGEAAKAGLLRHYREFRNNDWNFKGSLDLARHIRENVPLMHGIAYRKREIDLDVPVNRMILMAALTVNRRHPSLFERDGDAADALRQLRMGVTEARDVRNVLAHRDCREPVRHPFFREIWEPLRRIARMILEDEQWTLFHEGAEDEEVSGVVFDGSWLWEEYIATILTPEFRHCIRGGDKTQKGLKLLEGGPVRFYPDFYLKTDEASKRVVLDAKYKRFNPSGERSDVHQVLCYLLLTGAKLGGLVFPPVDRRAESESDGDLANEFGTGNDGWSIEGSKSENTIASEYSTQENPIRWHCFSWRMWKAGCDWESFKKHMEDQERDLKNGPNCFPFNLG